MALIEIGKLNELVSASSAKSTSDSAVDDINLQQVAYAINSAANTGQTEVVVMTPLTDNTLTQLEANGYTVVYKKSGAELTTVISWGNA